MVDSPVLPILHPVECDSAAWDMIERGFIMIAARMLCHILGFSKSMENYFPELCYMLTDVRHQYLKPPLTQKFKHSQAKYHICNLWCSCVKFMPHFKAEFFFFFFYLGSKSVFLVQGRLYCYPVFFLLLYY